MPERIGSTQRGIPAPPAITRHAPGSAAAPARAALAPPFLRSAPRAAAPPTVAPAPPAVPAEPLAPAYQLGSEEADRIARQLELLAQQVRSRQLPGLTDAQGPEDIAGLLIAAITDHVGRGN